MYPTQIAEYRYHPYRIVTGYKAKLFNKANLNLE